MANLGAMLDLESPPPLSAALLAGLPLRFLPTLPLALALRRMMETFHRLHPHVGERLAGLAGRRLLLDPADLPLAFVLTLTERAPRIAVLTQGQGPKPVVDAAVRGALSDLSALLEGRVDGDALFFSRRLSVTGDTELVVALRNALDDARVDLLEVIGRSLGHFGSPGRRLLDLARAGYLRIDDGVSLLAGATVAGLRDRADRQAVEIEHLRADLDELRRRPSHQRGRRDPAAAAP